MGGREEDVGKPSRNRRVALSVRETELFWSHFKFVLCWNCILFENSDAFCFSPPLSLPSQVRLLRFHGTNVSVSLSFPAVA